MEFKKWGMVSSGPLWWIDKLPGVVPYILISQETGILSLSTGSQIFTGSHKHFHGPA